MPVGHVGQAHGGVGLVDVLAAGAGRAVGVDAHVRRIDLDLDLVVDHRIDPDRGEAGVAPGVRVERRDAHQPVDAGLGLQPAVGVGARDLYGRRLDAGLLAAGLLDELHLHAVAPRPSACTCAAAFRPSPAPRCRRPRHGPRDSSRCRRPRLTAGLRARARAASARSLARLASASVTSCLALGLGQFSQFERVGDGHVRSGDSRPIDWSSRVRSRSSFWAESGSSQRLGFSTRRSARPGAG